MPKRTLGFGIALVAMLEISAPAWAGSGWRVTQSEHFAVYSQSSDAAARSALLWFEQLRAFYIEQTGLTLDHSPAVRVIAFGSAKEYEPYRLRSADAYYATSDGQDYIVMPGLGSNEFRVAAHEYAHLILHASGVNYPAWLREGISELFSTVRVSEQISELGGDLPARSQVLRRHAWMPLARLLVLPEKTDFEGDRETASLFYAQSWVLVDMLFFSPEYGPRFRELLTALNFGSGSLEAITKIFGKPIETIERDLHTWVDRRGVPAIHLPGVANQDIQAQTSDVTVFKSRSVLADLLMASGELERAQSLYSELGREAPKDPDIAAALGSVALRQGDKDRARLEWKRAIENGVTDARLCYRYAALAGMAGLPDAEIRPALERAVLLKPDFDDARYLLALLEKNAGHYEIAVAQLRAMKRVAGRRAFDYWSILSDALNELGAHDDAKRAADQAAHYANNTQERLHAAQLAYIAQTELAVQFSRDSSGRPQLVTTRIPHETVDWNPFIEAGDDLRRVRGALREIDCGGKVTRFVVEVNGTRLRLAIEDPTRVRMRNAPAEFVCGPQKVTEVTVEYAVAAGKGADGLVRGMDFQ